MKNQGTQGGPVGTLTTLFRPLKGKKCQHFEKISDIGRSRSLNQASGSSVSARQGRLGGRVLRLGKAG